LSFDRTVDQRSSGRASNTKSSATLPLDPVRARTIERKKNGHPRGHQSPFLTLQLSAASKQVPARPFLGVGRQDTIGLAIAQSPVGLQDDFGHRTARKTDLGPTRDVVHPKEQLTESLEGHLGLVGLEEAKALLDGWHDVPEHVFLERITILRQGSDVLVPMSPEKSAISFEGDGHCDEGIYSASKPSMT
jgi:hypothetical protein